MTNNTQQDERDRQNAYIDIRWKQLYELEKEWGKEAIKYLILLNSGGAVATLSFIGTSVVAQESLMSKLALICFFVGIVGAAVLIAYAFETGSNLFINFQRDFKQYALGKKNFENLVDEDQKRVPSGIVDRFAGYISFGAFIIGGIIGCVDLFNSLP